ncbi:MAG: hypothetical protein HOP11_02370 [Saprospiraceae bacterium]|nr:hypothetical protein [Saprospiraceae bacterium]
MSFWDKITGNDKNREDELREFAFQNQLDFSTSNDEGLIAQLSEFKLFKYGIRKTIKGNLFNKDIYENKYLFDYHYTISTGNSSRKFSQTVRLFDSKKLGIPEFRLQPERFMTMISEWFVKKDIDFHTDEEFSEMFHLTGEYESVIRTYFDEEVRRLCKHNKKFHIAASNYYLCIYIQNKILKKEELRAFYKLTNIIYELFVIQSNKHRV